MRIVTCPKCSSTQLNSEMKMGLPVMFQCTECGYYAERKEFKIEGIEVTVNSNLEEVAKNFRNYESNDWVTGYTDMHKERFDISIGSDLYIVKVE